MVKVKVGDKVLITKPMNEQNWAEAMDRYNSKVVTVKTVNNDGDRITFEDHGGWGFYYSDGHWRPIDCGYPLWD